MANELDLSTILNYRGNAQNALPGGTLPLDISLDNNSKLALNELSDFLIKKRQLEFKEYHDNMVNAIGKASNRDGIFEGDIEYIKGKQKETIESIMNNPTAMRGDAMFKNPKAYQEQNAIQSDYAAEVEKSRAHKAAITEFKKRISTDNDMNNEVNQRLLSQETAKSIDQRDISSLVPVSSGDKDLKILETEFYKTPERREVTSQTNAIDPNSVDNLVTGYYNKDAYIKIFTDAKGDYLVRKFELDPKLQADFNNDVNAYIKSEAEKRFREKAVIEKTQYKTNQEKLEQGRNARNAANNERAITVAETNGNYRVRVKEMESDIEKTSDYPDLLKATKDVSEMDANMDGKSLPIPEGFPAKEITVSNDYHINDVLRKEIEGVDVVIGKDEITEKDIKEKANQLARIVDNNDEIRYYPAVLKDDKYYFNKEKSYTFEQIRDASLTGAGYTQLGKYKERRKVQPDNSARKDTTPKRTSQPKKKTRKPLSSFIK